MRRADIEVPNLAVAGNARARSACYPRGSFYPLSHGPSTRYRRITSPGFRPCAACPPCSQAPFCRCTQRVSAIHPEGTLGRLRYLLGGDRPSQTAHQARSGDRRRRETAGAGRVVSHRRLRAARKPRLSASHLSCASRTRPQCQAAVKLHGVFLSCRGSPASSRGLQFRRALRRDSAQIVTPFVRVGTYPTRNFATLGPLELRPPFTGASVRSSHPSP
jgi:hypothetical protein